jgi:hypothetical protein
LHFLVFYVYINKLHGPRSKTLGKKNLRRRCAKRFNSGVKGLINGLEQKIMKFVHHSVGHLGMDNGLEETKYIFYVKDLGRKLRKFIARYNIRQRSEHPNL